MCQKWWSFPRSYSTLFRYYFEKAHNYIWFLAGSKRKFQSTQDVLNFGLYPSPVGYFILLFISIGFLDFFNSFILTLAKVEGADHTFRSYLSLYDWGHWIVGVMQGVDWNCLAGLSFSGTIRPYRRKLAFYCKDHLYFQESYISNASRYRRGISLD